MVWKSLGLVAVGAAAALVFSALLPGSNDVGPTDSVDTPFGDAPARQQVSVAAAPAATSNDSAALLRRVADLEAELRTLSETVAMLEESGAGGLRSAPPPKPEVIGVPPERMRTVVTDRLADPSAVRTAREREMEMLVAGGFAHDRADWILRRTEELTWEGMQAQYEAQRRGETVPQINPESVLRKELGDAEYERYLKARGRPTEVSVINVMSGSPAAKAGVALGDRLVSYGGQRVFDIRDLNQMILEGNPGEPVVLEVQRNGQTTQLVVPRGPLGISGSASGMLTTTGNIIIQQPGF